VIIVKKSRSSTLISNQFDLSHGLLRDPVERGLDRPREPPVVEFARGARPADRDARDDSVGITGGCQLSPPLYCLDQAVTRGQMAVFLSTALGLHFAP
jgi:hypothetical protein